MSCRNRTLRLLQIGGSLAKVVYFTRSPDPPASPSIVATRGSSTVSDVFTPGSSSPLSSSPPRDNPLSSSPPNLRINGALTPAILDGSHHGNGHPPTANGLAALDQLDHSALHESLLRRASVQHFPGGSLNFERFETEHIDDCVEFIQSLIERSAQLNGVSIEEMRQSVKIMATGGGAHRFHELFSEQLHVEVRREDEMECLIEGLKFITLIPDEAYYFSDELIHSVSHSAKGCLNGKDGVYERPSPDPPKYAVSFESNPTPQLPCLLVNIGSGVSIIRVDEDGSFERVSGTSLGGGTLWGLLSLLTPATTFDGEYVLAVLANDS